MQGCSLTSRVGAYYDGELEDVVRRTFDEHLDGCADCRAELGGVRRMSLLLGSQEPDALSSVELDRLRADAESLVGEAPPLRMFGGMMSAAASILIVCGAWWMELPNPQSNVNGASRQVASWDQAPAWEKLAVRGFTESPEQSNEALASDNMQLDWMLVGLGLPATGGGGREEN